MKKRLLFGLSVILSVFCLVCLMTVAAGATDASIETNPEMSIDYGGLVISDTIYLRYAANVLDNEVDDMRLLVWETAKDGEDAYVYGTEAYVLSPIGSTVMGGATYAVFDFTKMSHGKMIDYVYARPYLPAKGDAPAQYGPLNKYSALQYCYTVLGKTGSYVSTDAKLIKLVNAMMAYGAAAQEFSNYRTDWLATDSFYNVTVESGRLPDGGIYGLYKTGSKVVITANAPAEGYQFVGWKNAAGEIVSTDVAYEITVGEANENYTATYEEEVKYSQGLAFTSNGDGTCYVSGIGTCTDTELVIPPVSPEGWIVTGIGDRAFRNKKIISIILSDTIKVIEFSAFEMCSELEYISLGADFEQIEELAFIGCSKLKNISVSEKNAIYQSINGNLYSKDGTMLILYAPGQKDSSFVLPDEVTHVAESAFENNIYLNELSLSQNVKEIGSYALCGCENLLKIIFDGDQTTWDAVIKGEFWDMDTGDYQVVLQSQYSQGLEYKLSYDKSYYIVTGIGSCTDTIIVIPSVYEEKPVTEIKAGAFLKCNQLTGVVIPDSITKIGNSAFSQCAALSIVEFGKGLEYIDIYAFSECNSLETLYICGTNLELQSSSFRSCKALKKVYIEDCVEKLHTAAFLGCTNLEEVTLPVSILIEKTEDDVYYHPINYIFGISSTSSGENIMSTYYYQDSTQKYISSSYYYSPKLHTVNFIGSGEIHGRILSNYSSLSVVNIGEGITSVGYQAFENTALKEIYLPSTLKQLAQISNTQTAESGNNIMIHIPNIELWLNLEILTKGYFDSYELYEKGKMLTDITIPTTYTIIRDKAFAYCQSIKSITLSNKLDRISNYMFYECENLKNVYIPAGIVDIGAYAFAYSSIENLQCPSSLKTIEEYAFSNSYLKSILLNEGLQSIGNGAFRESAIQKIIIPDTVIEIGTSAFRESPLSEIKLSNNMKIISGHMFSYCEYLTNIEIPEGIETIDMAAFQPCSNLVNVTLPDSLKEIKRWAFVGCDKIETIRLGKNVEIIEDGSAFYCKSLKIIEVDSDNPYFSVCNGILYNKTTGHAIVYCYANTQETVILPYEIQTMDAFCFYSNPYIREVIIADSVTNIGRMTFSNCSNLSSFVIPKSVKNIEKFAFYDCTSLTDVYYSGTEEEWAAITIGTSNDPLLNATIHYNYDPATEIDE